MKFTKRAVAICLIVATLCALAWGCAKKSTQPEQTIMNLQKAINNFNVDGILACLTEEWAEPAKKVLSYTVGEDGLSVKTYLSLLKTLMPVLPAFTDGKIDADKLPKIEFTVLKTDVSGETAVVALAGLLIFEESSKPFAFTVDMEIQNEVWVITGVR